MATSPADDEPGGIVNRIATLVRSLALVANIPGIRGSSGLPPGSLGLPVLGETISYVRNSHRFFERRVEKYGPVFKTHLVFSPVVCFTGPKAYTFFANQSSFNRRGANPNHVKNLLDHHSLPLIDGAEHEQMRGTVLEAFSSQATETYLNVIEPIIVDSVNQWEQLGSFSWVSEYKKLSASICTALLGGANPGVDTEELVHILDTFLAGLTSLPVPLPFTKYGRAIRSRDKLLSYIDDAIGRQQSSPPNDMLAELQAAGDGGSPLSDAQLRAQVLHMYFAAYGGIYRTLTLLSLSLAKHPEVRERARAEVSQHAQTGPVTLEQLEKLTFLKQVTLEVRRHHRIFASTLFDWVAGPIEFEAFHVPEGWKATGGIYTTMQDRKAYTEPAFFNPDRFDPEHAEGLEENSYVPQGGGPMDGHRCPGEDLTTIIMQAVGVILLRHYTWNLPPQDLELDNESSPLPRDGLKVKFLRTQAGEPD